MTINFTLTLSNHHQILHALCFLYLTFICHLQLHFIFSSYFVQLYSTVHSTVNSLFVSNVLSQQDHSKATYTFLFCSTQRFIHLPFLLVEVFVCFLRVCVVLLSFYADATSHFHYDYCTRSTSHSLFIVCWWCMLFLVRCLCFVFCSRLVALVYNALGTTTATPRTNLSNFPTTLLCNNHNTLCFPLPQLST